MPFATHLVTLYPPPSSVLTEAQASFVISAALDSDLDALRTSFASVSRLPPLVASVTPELPRGKDRARSMDDDTRRGILERYDTQSYSLSSGSSQKNGKRKEMKEGECVCVLLGMLVRPPPPPLSHPPGSPRNEEK